MAKVTVTPDQFKTLCRLMLQESNKKDYVKKILSESLEKRDGKKNENN